MEIVKYLCQHELEGSGVYYLYVVEANNATKHGLSKIVMFCEITWQTVKNFVMVLGGACLGAASAWVRITLNLDLLQSS